jgi:drug/metabolite transporter (DMT)-like permease
MEVATTRPPLWKILLAFACIYILWGSTFFAIRVGVHEIPPLIFAAIRFLVAGLVLYAWMLARHVPSPTFRQWRAASLLGFLIFLVDYGFLFWAEQRVPSGIAAVMMATIPAFMSLAEIIFLRSQKLTARLALALFIGLAGVAILMIRSFHIGGAPISTTGAIALILASIAWSIASVLTRKLPLPPSKAMSAAAQMLTGGVMLTVAAAAFGEFPQFHPSTLSAPAWWSLLYLIIAGSLIGFTAYVWLIHHESPTKVGTYAYVNPVIAVVIGYFLGGEPLGLRILLGTLCVLISVIVITTTRSKKPATP